MSFPFFLAIKYLKPKRSWTSAVTFLATFGVVLGVAIIIIVRAVMTGFGDMWREKILAFKPHVTISSTRGYIRNETALVKAVGSIDGVTAVSPSVETRVLAEHRKRIVAPVVIGVTQDGLTTLHPELAGSIYMGSADLSGDKVIIGIHLASQLGLDIGDKFLIYSPMSLASEDEMFFPEEVVVGGIFRVGQRDYDSGFIISSIGFARDLMGMTDGAHSIHVKTNDPQNYVSFGGIVERIRSLMPPGYVARTWQEEDSEIFNALAVEKNMMTILLFFITVVAMFCVTSTLIVITVSKTNEIGLLKALGFSGRQIMSTFVFYGWIQCFAGTVLGVGLAYWVLNKLQNIIDLFARFGVNVFPENLYGLAQLPWRVLPAEVWQVVVMVIVFCTVSSILPAWIAARKDPAEALRS